MKMCYFMSVDGESGSVLPVTVAADELPEKLSREWWAEFMSAEDQYKVEHSGKLVVVAEILRQCEEIGDKVLVVLFSCFFSGH